MTRSARFMLLAALPWSVSAAAQECLPPLPPVEPQAGDQFGCSVAMGHGHVAVGANLDDEGAADAGSVTLYDRESRQLVAKLRASDGRVGDQLGFTVAFDGDLLAAGAPLADADRATDAGAVYLFERIDGTWQQTQKLAADDGARGDRFGQAVAFAAGVLLIGAPNQAARGSLSGAAYVFRRSPNGSFGQTQKLVATDAAPFDNFGHSVALDGATAVVGAPFADPGGVANAGSAYVFRNAGGTLTQTAKLVAEAAADNQFGWAVDVDGATIVVGWPGDDDAAGAVTVFAASGLPQLLIGPGHPPGARFGTAVSLLGNRLLVGAPEQGNGVVHVFSRSGTGEWTVTSSLPAPAGGGGYGQAAFLAADRLVVGAFEGAGLAQVCIFDGGPPPRLTVEKTTPRREASPGERVSYRIVVRNLEDRTVEAVRVTDELSPLFVPGSVTWCRPDDAACSDPQPGNIDHTVTLPGGGQAVFRAFGTLGETDRLRLLNVACAQNPEMPEPVCVERRILIVQSPTTVDLALTATLVGPVPARSVVPITLTATNAGPATATGVTLTAPLSSLAGLSVVLPLSAGCSLTPAAISCSMGTLAPLSSTSIILGFTAIDDCDITAVAAQFSVASDQPEANPSDNDASADAPVVRTADLAVAKAAASLPLTFDVSVTNLGPHNACGVVLGDDTPAGLLPALPPPLGCVLVASGFRCPLGEMVPGDTAGFTLAFTTPPNEPCEPLSVVNVATATADSSDPVAANDSASVTADVACPAPSGVNAHCVSIDGVTLEGEEITKSILLINGGPADQADNPGDEFLDQLPVGLTLVSAAASSGVVSTAGNAVMWNGAIPAGGQVTITITASIDAGTAGTTLCNQATVAFDADGNGTNESSGLSDPCCFRVLTPAEIPALSTLGLLAFALLTALLAWARLRRRIC